MGNDGAGVKSWHCGGDVVELFVAKSWEIIDGEGVGKKISDLQNSATAILRKFGFRICRRT